jgi:hypothetical protein
LVSFYTGLELEELNKRVSLMEYQSISMGAFTSKKLSGTVQPNQGGIS